MIPTKYKVKDVEHLAMQSIVSTYYKDIIDTVVQARRIITNKYGTGQYLCGKCIEASELIATQLRIIGYDARTIEGYCWYDTSVESCTDSPSGEHTWVQVYGVSKLSNKVLFIDITGEQFNFFLEYELDPIEIGSVPSCYHKGKPNNAYLREVGFI